MLIKALGGLELEGAEFRRPKLLLLLTYLSIEGTKDRRFISELFWGDKEDPTTNLRSAVYGIKKVMPLEVDDDSISMSPSVGCDATMLLQALDKKDLETAIKLYQGPFLEDARLPDISEELDEWIYSTRLYIGSKLRLALIQEAERLAVEGDFETAGAYAEKAYQVLDDSTLESTDLERLYTLLIAADHYAADSVRTCAQEMGFDLTITKDDALRTYHHNPVTIPTNIKPYSTTFVGREREITELTQYLETRPRVITITGESGSGKSRLVTHIALEQLKTDTFTDGIYQLAAYSDMNSSLLSLSNVQALLPGVPRGRDVLPELIKVIAEQRLLLVIDNFDDLSDGVSVVEALIEACPNVTFLLAARSDLNLAGEVVFPLGGLSLGSPNDATTNDALALFALRAQRVQREFELNDDALKAATNLCREVKGLPLAIELLASLSSSMAVTTLHDDFLSFATAKRLDPARIEAALAYAFNALNKDEQALLKSLTVFRGGFRREAASEVLSASIPLLTVLQDRMLVNVDDSGRYTLHPRILLFARDLFKREKDAYNILTQSHSQYFMQNLIVWGNALTNEGATEAQQALTENASNIQSAWFIAVRDGNSAMLQRVSSEVRTFLEQTLQLRLSNAIPYQGLSSFQANDAPFFFGREIYTQKVLEFINVGKPVIGIVGPSGSGKSSVARAGVQAQFTGDNKRFVSIIPGEKPLYALAAGLAPLLGDATSEAERVADIRALVDEFVGGLSLSTLMTRIQRHQPELEHIILLVDQWEELYTISDAYEQRVFIDALLNEGASTPRVSVILTLRADFYPKAIGYRPLADKLQDATITLAPMTYKELERTITEPAAKVGLRFDEGLVNRILDDVGDEPGALPLLEFTLTALWESQHSGRLMHEQYDRMGGVRGALAQRAEEVYQQLSSKEQESMRQVFFQLIHLNESLIATRRRAPLGGFSAEAQRIAQQLIKARLLVSNRDDVTQQNTVEVAHEALIEYWQRLQDWIQEDSDFYLWLQRLRRYHNDWQHAGQHNSALLRGVILTEARKRLSERGNELSNEEIAFIEASIAFRRRQEQQKKRRHRRNYRYLTAGLGITLALLVFAIFSWQRAETRRIEAERLKEIALARQLATQAVSDIRPFPQRSLLLSLESVLLQEGLDDMSAAFSESALREVLSNVGSIPLIGHAHAITGVVFSPDGNWLASVSTDGTARLWDMTDDTFASVVLDGQGEALREVKFSPDGRLLVTTGDEGVIRVYQTESPLTDPVILEGHTEIIRAGAVAFSPDGRWLATGSDDMTVRLWHVDDFDAEPIVLSKHKDVLRAVAFSPDGSLLATGGDDNVTFLWDMTALDTPPVELAGHTERVRNLEFSPSGQYLATVSRDATIFLWSLADLSEPRVLSGHTDSIQVLAFSPDEAWLATGSDDNTARLWSLTQQRSYVLSGHEAQVRALAFSPDGNWLVTGSDDNSARLWDVNDPMAEPTVLRAHEQDVNVVAFSPDSRWLVTGSRDEAMRLWTIGNPIGIEPQVYREEESRVRAVAMSPTQDVVAFGRFDGVVLLRNPSDLAAAPTILGKHDALVEALAFSPDGNYLASASDDHLIKIWNVNETASPRILQAHQDNVYTLEFSSDGRYLLSGGGDNLAYVWDLQDASLEPLRLSGHSDLVVSVDFGRDDEILATASLDGTVRIWQLSTGGNLRADVLYTLTHENGVRSLQFSQDMLQLVTGDQNGNVMLWDVSNLETAPTGQVLNGHANRVWDVEFSADRRFLATSSSDNTIRLWDTRHLDSEPIILLGHKDNVWDIAFSHDSRLLISSGRDDTLRLWHPRIEDIVQLACDSIGRQLTTREFNQFFTNATYRPTCTMIEQSALLQDSTHPTATVQK